MTRVCVLITGMSGTGKTSVIEKLRRRGYRAVDLDHPDWSVHATDGDWIWNEVRVWELLSQNDEQTLFISGCAENQGKFYPVLNALVLLSAPVDVINERLRTRTNNPYGKTPEELALVLHHIETVEPLIRRGCTHEIDTGIPLDNVVDRVLEIAGTIEIGQGGRP